MKTWIEHVQYRAECDGCGETHMVSVIQRREKPRLRLCRSCFALEAWHKPSWDDARFQRIRAARLQAALMEALRERDEARGQCEAMANREVGMLSQPFFRQDAGPVGIVMDRTQSWDVTA